MVIVAVVLGKSRVEVFASRTLTPKQGDVLAIVSFQRALWLYATFTLLVQHNPTVQIQSHAPAGDWHLTWTITPLPHVGDVAVDPLLSAGGAAADSSAEANTRDQPAAPSAAGPFPRSCGTKSGEPTVASLL